jgi:fructose-1,6-bisphosphatase II
MDRNLALEFVRVTEAAALSAAGWMGKGDKIEADRAAVEAMRKTLNSITFSGTIVIGEGEKDAAPMLYSGEKVGKDTAGMHIDLAVDPLECTSNLAMGKPNAISVLAAGTEGSLKLLPGTYMDQIVVGRDARGCIDLKDTVEGNLGRVAKALGKEVAEVTVCILDRPRLARVIEEVRAAGARIRLIDHGTVNGALAAGLDDSGIDLLMGDGGAPEAVIIAAAMRCLGGEIQARLKPHNEKTKQECRELGLRLDTVYSTEDLAGGDTVQFAATGVSDGPFLRGVVFTRSGAITHSVVMRSKTGTIRHIEARHRFDLKPKY